MPGASPGTTNLDFTKPQALHSPSEYVAPSGLRTAFMTEKPGLAAGPHILLLPALCFGCAYAVMLDSEARVMDLQH
jgi:hypothetical protein